jgi:hypothetical protein
MFRCLEEGCPLKVRRVAAGLGRLRDQLSGHLLVLFPRSRNDSPFLLYSIHFLTVPFDRGEQGHVGSLEAKLVGDRTPSRQYMGRISWIVSPIIERLRSYLDRDFRSNDSGRPLQRENGTFEEQRHRVLLTCGDKQKEAGGAKLLQMFDS